METFELRYFLGVARRENVQRAARDLHVSPGSLSKAVARLESELGVKLFRREGRRIRLSDPGRILQLRASQIIHLEESARAELAGAPGAVRAVLAGPELLLARFAPPLTARIRARHPGASFELQTATEDEAIARVAQGDSHLAILTRDPPPGLHAHVLGEAHFQTYAGHGHPLHAAGKAGRTLTIEKVLAHGFVSPSQPVLGALGGSGGGGADAGRRRSLDGWRDDKFPRRIEYLASSVELIGGLCASGQALAYLPDYYGASLGLVALKITGCPYSCHQTVRLVVRDLSEVSWLKDAIG